MQITPVDSENNLFSVKNLVSPELCDAVLSTPWLDLPRTQNPDQANLLRRRQVINASIPWISQWDRELDALYPVLENMFGVKLQPYYETAWWIDKPGFRCPLHTDGELPISLQMMWIGNKEQGTKFYWYKNFESLRYQVEFRPNNGYIMRNLPDANGYRKLLWHAMMQPIPPDTFRLTSYTAITPQNL